MTYKSISIPLSETEFRKLYENAGSNCRRPQEQARFLVLSGLGLADPQPPQPPQRKPKPKSKPATVVGGFTNN